MEISEIVKIFEKIKVTNGVTEYSIKKEIEDCKIAYKKTSIRLIEQQKNTNRTIEFERSFDAFDELSLLNDPITYLINILGIIKIYFMKKIIKTDIKNIEEDLKDRVEFKYCLEKQILIYKQEIADVTGKEELIFQMKKLSDLSQRFIESLTNELNSQKRMSQIGK